MRTLCTVGQMNFTEGFGRVEEALLLREGDKEWKNKCCIALVLKRCVRACVCVCVCVERGGDGR